MKFYSIRYIKEVFKAYTEGIYADTPANRKLGRVGMTYVAWEQRTKAEKQKQKEEGVKEELTPELQEKVDGYKRNKRINQYPWEPMDNTDYPDYKLNIIPNNSSNYIIKTKTGSYKEIFFEDGKKKEKSLTSKEVMERLNHYEKEQSYIDKKQTFYKNLALEVIRGETSTIESIINEKGKFNEVTLNFQRGLEKEGTPKKMFYIKGADGSFIYVEKKDNKNHYYVLQDLGVKKVLNEVGLMGLMTKDKLGYLLENAFEDFNNNGRLNEDGTIKK